LELLDRVCREVGERTADDFVVVVSAIHGDVAASASLTLTTAFALAGWRLTSIVCILPTSRVILWVSVTAKLGLSTFRS
jgi:hypothetical protein